MIAVPRTTKIDSMLFYLRIKWLVLSVLLIINVFEACSGLVSMLQASVVFAGILLVAVPGVLLRISLGRKGSDIVFAYLSLICDVLIVFISLYFHGGVENSWIFLPPLIIFMAAYIFDFRAGLIFAVFSYMLLVIMAYVQYSGVLPSYPLFELPQAHWRNTRYLMDYLAGSFAYYMLAAFAVGALTRLAATRAERVDEFRTRLDKATAEEVQLKEKIRKTKVEILVKTAEIEKLSVYSAHRQLRLIDLRRKLDELKKSGR